jgi:hypothetical protein
MIYNNGNNIFTKKTMLCMIFFLHMQTKEHKYKEMWKEKLRSRIWYFLSIGQKKILHI